jgi:hypothetical protein
MTTQPLRFKNALGITDPGACNPSGIAHALVEAFAELQHEGGDTNSKRTDPAVRLMVYQLAYLCNVASMPIDDYHSCTVACQDKLDELGQKRFGEE